MRSTRATIGVIGLTLLVAAAPIRAADCRHLPTLDSPRAAGNDNRTPAGTVRDGVVILRLVCVTLVGTRTGEVGAQSAFGPSLKRGSRR